MNLPIDCIKARQRRAVHLGCERVDLLPEGPGPLPQDPSEEEIAQRAAALRRGWSEKRLNPEYPPLEMGEQPDPRRSLARKETA